MNTSLIMPTDPREVERWNFTRSARRMLEGVFEQDIVRRLSEMLTPGRIMNLGRPTQSLNMLQCVTHQIAVQYDSEAAITNENLTDVTAAMFEQIKADAHLWAIQQKNSELVYGLRENFIKIEWTSRGPRLRIVPADTVVVRTEPGDPNQIIEMREAMTYPIRGGQEACWDVWDISDAEAPTFRVLAADGRDVTALAYPEGVFPDGYPYLDPEGQPFIPCVLYRAQYTCDTFDPYALSQLVHGTLDVAIFWTAWAKALLDASWPQRWILDLMLEGMSVNTDGATATATVECDRTSILNFRSKPDKAGQVGQFQPGGDPEKQANAVIQFQATLLSNIGIHPADLEASTQPSSGVAIQLKRSAQRKQAARLVPNLRQGDQELLRKLAMVHNIHSDLPDLPVDGWEIEYRLPEQSIDEFVGELDRDERLIGLNLMSRVDLFMKLHPRLTRDDAMARMLEIQLENEKFSMTVGAPEVGASPTAGEPTPMPAASASKIALTSTDIAGIVTVDEARSSQGLGPIGGIDGALTVTEFQAKHAAVTATAAAAASGQPV